MKKCRFLFFACVLCSHFLHAQEENIEKVLISKLGEDENISSVKNAKDSKEQKEKSSKNILFVYKDEDLIDVINDVAAAKGVNVILPEGAKAIKSKVTITIPDKLTVDEAWNTLNTILDIAGYAILPRDKEGKQFLIDKIDNNLARHPMRIFISEPFNKIPDTDERIVYIAYFENIQVPSQTGVGGGRNIVQELLKTFLSKEVAEPAKFKFISSANGVMMIDKASNIRSTVKILAELDKVEIKEHLEIITLQHTSSEDIAKMFNETILEKTQQRRFRLGTKRKSEIRYFERGTRIVPETRTNSLILVGNKEAIQKVKQFIFKYIDVTIESGKSILHRKKLQYMHPNKLRDVLRNVLAGVQDGVQARPGAPGRGAERFFQGVKIETDYPADVEGEGEEGKYKYYGTNSLLVAAKSDDWVRIEKLIDDLDKPLKQIIVEVLIVDVSLDSSKLLGGHTRNPALAPLMQLSRDGCPIEFQSAQLEKPVTEACTRSCNTAAEGSDPSESATLSADLMKKVAGGDDPNLFLAGATPGSSLLTLSDKDGRTWSVLKLLCAYDHAKVLSHPYVVTVNNKEAFVEISEKRRLNGAAEQTAAGAAEVKVEDVPAKVGVTIRPRIGAGNTVNMEVKVEIEEFRAGSIGDRLERSVITNANVATDEILVLGGLIRNEDRNVERKSPILGRIPVLGWFFKQRSNSKTKNNLTVFIRPTIVEPQLRGGMGRHTKHYIKMAKQYSKEGRLFEGLRDPVTRWFFKTETDVADVIDMYVEQHAIQKDLEMKLVDSQDKPDNQVMLAQGESKTDSQEKVGSSETSESFKVENEKVIVVDNDALEKSELKLEKNDVIKSDVISEVHVDTTLELAAQSAAEMEREVTGHDKLRGLLQGEENPLVS